MSVEAYRDDEFEWAIAKSNVRLARSGFDFHAASRIFRDNYIERLDEVHSEGEERWIATGLFREVFISVVYTTRGARRRIISAFYADDDDITEYLVTYANKE